MLKESVLDNKDRKPAKILEEYNKKLKKNSMEEEKIDLKNVLAVVKEKNKINKYKYSANFGGDPVKIDTIRDLERAIKPY